MKIRTTGFCINLLQRAFHNLTPLRDGHCISHSVLDSLTVSLEIVYRELVVLELTDELSSVQKDGVEIVRSCLNTIRGMQRLNQLSGSRRPPRALCIPTGAVGQPKYEISELN